MYLDDEQALMAQHVHATMQQHNSQKWLPTVRSFWDIHTSHVLKQAQTKEVAFSLSIMKLLTGTNLVRSRSTDTVHNVHYSTIPATHSLFDE
jgi:hypothetical protein